ncbi:MAG: branched-chain amino acid transaminase [Acidobacteriota bacterium]|nr:branched-chain amino acid transaminase [Acidobacteriota bacterium]
MFSNTHFSKAKKYWYMGKFYDWSEPIFHPMMHALHYGTSTFEGIRAYLTPHGPAIFRLKEHVDRLFHSASVIKMKVLPFTKEEIIQACKDVIRENGLDQAYIRPLMFYSYGNLGLVPSFCPIELLIGAWEWGAYLGETGDKGVFGCIVPKRRIHISQLDLSAKLGGVYVQSTINGLEARERGYDEAIFLNLEGRIAEGPGENICLIKNNVLHANSASESVLEGITRSSLLEIAPDLGLKTLIAPITKEDLFSADEAFYCGTAAEISPITKVADLSEKLENPPVYIIGSGKPGVLTMKLAEAYRQIVTGKNPKYEKWLAYVNK